jgi:hypothetical protein
MPAREGPGPKRARWLAAGVILLLAGCSRRYYREFADRDTYRIEQQRMTDWRWNLPPRSVEADLNSRIGDIHDPDRVPIPPDDPGARPFQVTAGRPLEFVGWKKRGTTPVEDLRWLDALPRDAEGQVDLNAAMAMKIGLMNSRDYQTQVEEVYLQALALTGTRFQFFLQGFANQDTVFEHSGAGKTEQNQLQLVTSDGFSWLFYSGAQLLVNFANTFIFEYNGKSFQTVNSGLSINLIQPLLSGAFARNVTQPLSLVERQTLYTIRTFAQFRRGFYVTVVSGYLNLLNQVQSIRNQESQVQALKRNLDEYEALVRAAFIDPLQRDQIAQTYQQARFSLLQLEATFQTSLDAYRVQTLGLPADFPLKVDDGPLKLFELNDPRLDDLRKENEALYLSLLQYDRPPDRSVMADTARKLIAEYIRLREVSNGVAEELGRWLARIEKEKGKVGTGPGPLEEDERESFRRQLELSKELEAAYKDARQSIDKDLAAAEKFLAALDALEPEEAFRKLLLDMVARDFRARYSELFVVQTQVRVYLIELAAVPMTLDQAITTAIENRLDLMNALAGVTDAWRDVEFGANQLLPILNVFYAGNLNTSPLHRGIFDFDAANSQHEVGLQFSAPINRRLQRNAYRSDQILYQRARRAYMLTHDQIVQQIRLDMRTLNLNRRQFEIGRISLLIAARQVDQAEYNARTSTGSSSGAGQSAALNLLPALSGLLQAKNSLIQNWVAYEIQRMSLYRDFDLMNIDAFGNWTNDRELSALGRREPLNAPPDVDPGSSAIGREPLFPPPAGGSGPFGRP